MSTRLKEKYDELLRQTEAIFERHDMAISSAQRDWLHNFFYAGAFAYHMSLDEIADSGKTAEQVVTQLQALRSELIDWPRQMESKLAQSARRH